MTKIVLDERQLKKEGISIEEAILYLYNKYGIDSFITGEELVDKGLFEVKVDKEGTFYANTQRFDVIMSRVLQESGSSELANDIIASFVREVPRIAQAMKEAFPKGRKDSMYPWTEGISLIEKRLITFSKKYGVYDPDDIIKATKDYVAKYHGDYSRMRTLKYFIFKEDRGSGTIESSSDLYTILEEYKEGITPNTTPTNYDWIEELA